MFTSVLISVRCCNKIPYPTTTTTIKDKTKFINNRNIDISSRECKVHNQGSSSYVSGEDHPSQMALSLCSQMAEAEGRTLVTLMRTECS